MMEEIARLVECGPQLSHETSEDTVALSVEGHGIALAGRSSVK